MLLQQGDWGSVAPLLKALQQGASPNPRLHDCAAFVSRQASLAVSWGREVSENGLRCCMELLA